MNAKAPHMDDGISSGLSRIRARFIAGMHEQSTRLETLKLRLHDAPDDDDALREVGQIAHKIAGTAATLGFQDLGALASQIDDSIHRLVETNARINPDIVQMIDSFHSRTRQVAAIELDG